LTKDGVPLATIVDLKHSRASPLPPHNWLALAPGVYFMGCCQTFGFGLAS